MSYCLNPNCNKPNDPMNGNGNIFCRHCGENLLLANRYRVINILGNGGFARTFEVECKGKIKVLKVLDLSRFHNSQKKHKVIDLFRREAEVLSRLNHSGIPKVDADGYFEVRFPNSAQPLHCLVMEKIEGVNLQQWLENQENKSIAIEQAIAYLKQLVEILSQVHAHGYFHRDIKPTNIMVRPDGNLGLIDFGAVRNLAQTYLQEEAEDTIIGTLGYSPPEQMNGKAVAASDFFALGRTFVYLLTGKPPLTMDEHPQTGKLIWRNQVLNQSTSWLDWLAQLRRRSLFDLLDDMMEPSWRNRPENTQAILQRLNNPLTLPSIPPWVARATILLGLGLPSSYWYLNGVDGCTKIWLRSFPQNDRISCGEEILLPNINLKLPEKELGVQAIATNNYQTAISLLEQAWLKYRDPETLIYLNNARLAAAKIKSYTIAVVVPISDNNDVINYSKEILRGVAEAQNNYNQDYQNKKFGLKVLVASDNNKIPDAQQIAVDLVNKHDVLAVIGHFRSDTTIEAVKFYQQRNLLLISPTATSEDLSTICNSNSANCFFRVVPSNRVIAQSVAKYLIQQNKLKAATFFNPHSNYSKSLLDQMKAKFSALGGKVVAEIPLDDNWQDAISQVEQQKADVIVLFPTSDGLTSDSAVQVIEYAKKRNYLVIGGDSLDNPKLLKALAKNPGDSIVAIPWHPRSRINQEFPKQTLKFWGKTGNWHSALTYDATLVLLAALEKIPAPSRENVRKMLADTNFKTTGATGVISFQKNGDRRQENIDLVKVVQNQNTGQIKFIPLEAN